MAQLKSTNVTGNLSVTGNILASKIIKIGGTSNQILMANGETTNLSDILGKLNAAVILKGTLGTDGTIQALPSASATVLGHAYKVITKATYGGIAAKVGDMFICYESGTSTYAWMLIPSGDDIENTWRPIKLEGTQILTNGTSSNPLNFKQGANITITHNNGDLTIEAADTSYGADRGISLSNGKFGHSNAAITAQATKGLYKISYDAYGHITGTESYTDQNTTYSFASGTNSFTVTPSGGSAQTVGVTADRFFRLDTRSANSNPYATDNYPGYTTVHLKYNDTVGISNEGTYSALMQIYPWGDSSGGAAHQLVYGSNGGIYHRYGTSTWSSWSQLATREWVESLGYIDDISDYVTGPSSATSNAIALYDGTTGKKIKNSGATIDANRNLKFNGPGNISWEDGSYYQRIQITDDSNTETAVFTFQQTENSGTAWNDLFTIQDRGTIIAKNSSGGALSLTLDRGSNANWRWLSDNGNFIAQCDYTTAKGSYFNVLTMNYNTGHVSVDKGSLTSKQGFIHGGLTAASGKTKDDYVLLAGGGHKAVSDFAGSDVGADYLPLAGGTMKANATITLPNSAKIVHHTNTTSNYVTDAIWYKGTSAVGSGYDAQIGWHNTGDTNGAIILLPYTTTTEPWSSNVGLYISKTRLKYNGTNISLEGHGHTDMVTGSGLTANNIVVGNGNSAVKISGVSIDTSNNVSIPGKLTVSSGAQISGRSIGSGDDEGLIISRASNGYAGLILGGAAGNRSVFYLMPETHATLPKKAVWRYNDGTNQSEIVHPGKSGTIALLSDLGSGGDYDVSQVSVTAEDAKATRYLAFVDAHETKKQSLKVDDDIYYASDNNYNWSSLNVGKSTKNGILTLHRYTGTSDRYVNLQVQNAISTSYTVYMPPAAGTLATQEWVDDNVDSANNSKITISTSGKGLSGSDYFNLNQSSNKTITITLDSSTAGNRTAEQVVIAKADGQINSMKYAITNDSDVVKASWQYNASTECVELVWA